MQNVDLLLDGEVSETDSTTPFDSFTLTLNPGAYNVTLVAYNVGGNSTSDEILITVIADETSETTTTTTTTEAGTPGFILLTLFVGLGLGVLYRRRK